MTPQTETPQAAPTLPATPNAGYKSTEFGVTLATLVSIGSGLIPQQYVPMVAAVAGVYMACRTLLKAAHALGYANSIPDLPALPALPQLPPGSTSITTTTVPKG